ncbi:MAG: flagellar basal body-associated FliL family protein [Micavibrio sp.]|nr:flagellar basal body-associated FliL family protein [Micavibrio sp.]|tara:strand:- start:679 stop:1137 length:459 start_codon:yes stop_codon:yes gene_type:complete
MKKIAVIALILAMLGGGAFAYFNFNGEAVASIPDGKEAKASGHDNANLSFVELDPLILPIVDKSGVSQVVSMVIALEVHDAESAALVERLAPKLKDAYIQDLYGVLNYKAALQGGVIQVGEVKKRLNAISIAVLGEDVVTDVLLQVVSQRPV